MQQRSPLGLIRAQFGLNRNPFGSPSGRAELRRRIGGRNRNEYAAVPAAPITEQPSDPRVAVDQVLGDILQSACQLVGAERSYLLLSRDERSVEVVASHRIEASEVVHSAFTRAANALQHAFSTGELTCADEAGELMSAPTATRGCCPALVCAPLESAMKVSGLLCLQRGHGDKKLSALDVEILQALAEQAGTALAAVRTHDTLSRLNAALQAAETASAS